MTRFNRHRMTLLGAWVLMLLGTSAVSGQSKHLLTPQDCTQMRYLMNDGLSHDSSLQESPDHTKIAYIVQAPNIASNTDETALYVSPISDDQQRGSTPVLVNANIRDLTWFPDSVHLAALIQHNNKSVLVQIDTESSTVTVIGDDHMDIRDYSMDRNADSIVISVKMPPLLDSPVPSSHSLDRGYVIETASSGYATPSPRREIDVLRKSGPEHWDDLGPISFVSPVTGKQYSSFIVGGGLDTSLSPDGRYVVFDNIEFTNTLPKRWLSSPYVDYLRVANTFVVITYVYNLTTHEVSVPLESPLAREHTVWSPDSKYFFRVALPPIGSIWEQKDMQSGALSDHNTHLFSVNVYSGAVDEVAARAEREPIGWTDNGNLLIRGHGGEILPMSLRKDKWTKEPPIRIPLDDLSPYVAMSTNGTQIIGEYQNASIPPQIFQFDLRMAQVKVIKTLDPEVAGFVLPGVQHIQWRTPEGYLAKGLLLIPPNYDPHRRYPLVIENGSILYTGSFVCDAGVDHVSSFARAMLADNGIMYLMRQWPGNDDWESNFYPSGYPGKIAEAVFRMHLVESAVEYLDDKGMIDPARVGLLGFSRGGWYTEFALMFSKLHFAAASATDNTEYAYGAYWYLHSSVMTHIFDTMYGGTPYGKTLQNWKDYSISFNTERIHTPLLKEEMGYGQRDDNPVRPPNSLAIAFELVTALEKQNKPVELYYYPNEVHQVEHPVARIASLQRNIDWFRFWLQGYERPHPDDKEQYIRWEEMRRQAADK